MLLQAEDISLDHRMALLGLGLRQIDAYYKNKEQHKIAGYIDRYLFMLSQTEDAASLLPSERFNPLLLLQTFLSSSAHSQGYKQIQDKVKSDLQVDSQADINTGKATLSFSMKAYEQRRVLFQTFTDTHPFFLENVMVMLFTVGQWCAMPRTSHSIWEQYMYACWVYSNLKFVLTACMNEHTAEEDLVDTCVILFRSWLHNEQTKVKAINRFHETGCDTPAHMAMLIQAG